MKNSFSNSQSMIFLNFNELVSINGGGKDPSTAEAYNNGKWWGANIRSIANTIKDFFG